MGGHVIWAVMLADCGREIARIAVPASKARGTLPLRDIAIEALKQGAAALVLVRTAADAACAPCSDELSAIDTARRTLGAIGVKLHDYILWYGERVISLRSAGRL